MILGRGWMNAVVSVTPTSSVPHGPVSIRLISRPVFASRMRTPSVSVGAVGSTAGSMSQKRLVTTRVPSGVKNEWREVRSVRLVVDGPQLLVGLKVDDGDVVGGPAVGIGDDHQPTVRRQVRGEVTDRLHGGGPRPAVDDGICRGGPVERGLDLGVDRDQVAGGDREQLAQGRVLLQRRYGRGGQLGPPGGRRVVLRIQGGRLRLEGGRLRLRRPLFRERLLNGGVVGLLPGGVGLRQGDATGRDGDQEERARADEQAPEAAVDRPLVLHGALRGGSAVVEELALGRVEVGLVLGGPVERRGQACAPVEVGRLAAALLPVARRRPTRWSRSRRPAASSSSQPWSRGHSRRSASWATST